MFDHSLECTQCFPMCLTEAWPWMNPWESGKHLTTVCWHWILSKLSFSHAHLHSLRVLKFVPQITDMPLLLLMILWFIGYVNIGHKVLKWARKQFTDSIINISPKIMPTTAVLSARCSAQIGRRKPQVSTNVMGAYVLLCGQLQIPVGHNPGPELFCYQFSGTFASNCWRLEEAQEIRWGVAPS